ncbi:MAG: alpha/beta fold hydrolase, partial [Pseudomonadota bacterium]
AAAASPASVDRLLKGTGSQINADGKRLYLSLISSRSHVDGTLRMMANWSLDGLLARLPRNQQRTHLMVGDNDTTVPPKTSEDAARRMPHATLERLPKLGHLMHEEAPDLIADRVRAALAD